MTPFLLVETTSTFFRTVCCLLASNVEHSIAVERGIGLHGSSVGLFIHPARQLVKYGTNEDYLGYILFVRASWFIYQDSAVATNDLDLGASTFAAPPHLAWHRLNVEWLVSMRMRYFTSKRREEIRGKQGSENDWVHLLTGNNTKKNYCSLPQSCRTRTLSSKQAYPIMTF